MYIDNFIKELFEKYRINGLKEIYEHYKDSPSSIEKIFGKKSKAYIPTEFLKILNTKK
ncbi:MAG: hypothetical protein M0R46_04470 [Candidatus Muirbacterium halophilum]|nr:hypothetical protein [Candidatus Muirbacterium halophilum]MCK9475149.1 hypothetical protein [Candidatus Muirbacterium halophilum]